MSPRFESVHPVLMSRDIKRSVRFYEALGFALAWQDSVSEPRYAVIERDSVQLHLQWHDATEWKYPNDRPTYRFVIDDVDGYYAELRHRADATDFKPVTETPWGTREFHVRDPDLNGLQFYRPL